MKSLASKIVVSVAVSVAVTAALNYINKKNGLNVKSSFLFIQM